MFIYVRLCANKTLRRPSVKRGIQRLNVPEIGKSERHSMTADNAGDVIAASPRRDKALWFVLSAMEFLDQVTRR